MAEEHLETVVRQRLRGLRQSLGWSLDEMAERTFLSSSTISRIETGNRTIGLDILSTMATALQVDLDALLDVGHRDDPDVVIRPVPSSEDGVTIWPLSRPTGTTRAIKMRVEPTDRPPEQRVHVGHDWMFVLSGRVRLHLAERSIVVERGEAAEFSTMTPHSFEAIGRPAEVIMVFDQEGHRAHMHSDVRSSE